MNIWCVVCGGPLYWDKRHHRWLHVRGFNTPLHESNPIGESWDEQEELHDDNRMDQ